jgi:hypothetical protein
MTFATTLGFKRFYLSSGSNKINLIDMTTIQSPDHLLQHLARKGDPSAFYTLVEPFARETYRKIRIAGKNHKETMSLLVPFLKKLYRDFRKKPADVDIGSWYAGNVARQLHDSEEPGQNAAEAMLPEMAQASDFSHLDSQMKLLFMRNYGKIREQEKRFGLKALRSNPWAGWVLWLLLLCIACTGLQIYLTFSHTQITLSIGTASFHHAMTLPDAINRRILKHGAVQSASGASNPASTQPISLPPETTTGKSADTIQKISINTVAKKRYVSQLGSRSSDSSNAFQKPAKSKKAAPDSLVPVSAPIPGYSGQTTPQHIPKPRTMDEKPAVPTQTGKQRATLSDSTVASPR